jgi:hypothetical protein
MKARNADDIRRRALAMGAEALIEGRAFNSAGLRAVAPRPKPVVAKEDPPPAAPAPQPLDVEALATAMAAAMVRALPAPTAALPPAPAPKAAAREQRITPAHDKHGRITSMAISADGVQTHTVRISYDADDQVTDLVIKKT